MNEREFHWRDGERAIRFGGGLLAAADRELERREWGRFELLTTPRALAAAPVALARAAHAVREVAPGPVPAAAAGMLDAVEVPTLVALGGGRVIDVAKAIAAVRGGRVAAIPTTLSGAEMTRIHRLPEGREAPHLVRPALVLADPEEMTGLPEDALRASALNALAHGAESLWVPGANPVASLAALRGAELIALALDRARHERDRAALALGSLLCAYAIDSAGLALHHVVCQSLVRALELPHAETNAALLPAIVEAMRPRAPGAVEALAARIGADPERAAERVATLGGGRRRLSGIGADRDRVAAAVEAMLGRPELARTPDPPSGAELRALVESAW